MYPEGALHGLVSVGLVPMVHELMLECLEGSFYAHVVLTAAFVPHAGHKAVVNA